MIPFFAFPLGGAPRDLRDQNLREHERVTEQDHHDARSLPLDDSASRVIRLAAQRNIVFDWAVRHTTGRR